MAELVAVALLTLFLALFVFWGATTDPNRPFSWAMYSGSTKAFLWTESDGRLRVPGYDDLRLSPDSHYLSLPDLRRLTGETHIPVSVQGLIIGPQGSWLVTYDSARRSLEAEPLAAGEELGCLVAALRRLECG